jgi:hypothetical protein
LALALPEGSPFFRRRLKSGLKAWEVPETEWLKTPVSYDIAANQIAYHTISLIVSLGKKEHFLHFWGGVHAQ